MILEEAYYRQRMMNYRRRHMVAETAIVYKTSEKTVKKWWKRWEETVESLKSPSRRPKNSPHKTSEEMLKRMCRI